MEWARAWFGVRAQLFGLGLAVVGLWTVGMAGASPGIALANGTCNLGHGVQHVVILQFDNVHSERDNPNVPSDLEQMPALRNFITSNGTLLTNDRQVVSVTCKEEGGSSHGARAVLALTRGTRIVGWGEGTLSHSIALHHRMRLQGRYVLTVTVVGGPRTTVRLRF